MFFRHLIRVCLFAIVPSLTFAMAAQRQERTSGDVLTLDRAIELARANNRETRRAKFDIDRQREASAEAKTQYYPRFDTYFLVRNFCDRWTSRSRRANWVRIPRLAQFRVATLSCTPPLVQSPSPRLQPRNRLLRFHESTSPSRGSD